MRASTGTHAFTRKRKCRRSDRLTPMAGAGGPVREGTLELDDGRALGYAEYGQSDGTPIVYLHGMPGSRLDPAALDQEYRQLGARVVALESGLATACRPGADRGACSIGRPTLRPAAPPPASRASPPPRA